MSCPLALVAAGGLALTTPLSTPAGARELPHGSLVRRVGECPAGVSVEVLSVAGWYPAERPAAPGDRGCLPAERLTGTEGAVFVTLGVTGDLPSGEELGPVTDAGSCDTAAYPFATRTLPVPQLSAVRAVSPTVLEGVRRVRATYAELFGPIGLHELAWTDWGRVALPVRRLSPEAFAGELARERLVTPAQRERAVVAEGPAWTHFWGADPPGSDLWAAPDTIVQLLRLAHGWSARCGGDPRCVISVGDLAWYNDTRPDPLGHRDHTGACVDLRLFRDDGSRYEAWWNRPDDRTGLPAYDRARTTEFLRFAMANAPVTDVFFNDPEVTAAVPGVRPLAGHDDHVHLCFSGEGPLR